MKTKDEIKSKELDRLFSSLGDSTRRTILEKVKGQPQNINKLAVDFNMSLPAVSKHIRILTEAGLITKVKDGRFIYCRYNHRSMKPALQWISDQHDMWNTSFNRLASYMKEKSKQK